jgi:hypothetical protein
VLLQKKEGIVIGISSGATLWAALQLTKISYNKGKLIVVIAAFWVNHIFQHYFIRLKSKCTHHLCG